VRKGGTWVKESGRGREESMEGRNEWVREETK